MKSNSYSFALILFFSLSLSLSLFFNSVSQCRPNLITLLGFCFIVFNLILVLIFVPDLIGPGPSWLYFSFALGVWLYSTFDNVDGKQARRTNSSSPLGELFDHGCDAINCSIGAIVQAASLGLGHTTYAGTVALLTTVAFYFSTWEEYHTGTLYLGIINGPTEGILIGCFMSIISGLYGPLFWHQKGTQVLPSFITQFFPTHYTLINYCLFMMTFLLLTTQIPFSIHKVHQTCRSPNRKYSFRSALLQLVPMGLFLSCNTLWLMSSYSITMQRHLILFLISNGIVFGRMATKIILAHVTKMPFPMFSTNMLFPLVVGTTLVYLPYFTGSILLTPKAESIFLYCYFLAAILNYFHWAKLVIDRFCEFLGISCLTLKHKKRLNGSKLTSPSVKKS